MEHKPLKPDKWTLSFLYPQPNHWWKRHCSSMPTFQCQYQDNLKSCYERNTQHYIVNSDWIVCLHVSLVCYCKQRWLYQFYYHHRHSFPMVIFKVILGSPVHPRLYNCFFWSKMAAVFLIKKQLWSPTTLLLLPTQNKASRLYCGPQCSMYE